MSRQSQIALVSMIVAGNIGMPGCSSGVSQDAVPTNPSPPRTTPPRTTPPLTPPRTTVGAYDAAYWRHSLKHGCDDLGCFAWSTSLGAAACQDFDSVQFPGGGRLPAVQVTRNVGVWEGSSHCRPVSSASLDQVARRLTDHGFRPIELSQRRPMGADTTIRLGRATITWTSRVVSPGNANQATSYGHSISATCAAPTARTQTIIDEPAMAAATGFVWDVGSHLVVSIAAPIPDFPDLSLRAGVFDLSSCDPAGTSAPR